MPLDILRRNIIEIHADAIVNAANNNLQKSGGVCGAIFEAAGTRHLQEACNKIGRCETGSAVATEGFALSKYIIHTVGPVWQGGNNNERNILYACYMNSLSLAMKYGCKSIAFPLLSSGKNGLPNDKALRVAVKAIGDFLLKNDMDVSLVIAVDTKFSLGGKLHLSIQSFIKDNYSVTHYEKIDQSEFEALRNAAASHMQPSKSKASSGVFDMIDVVWDRSRTAFARQAAEPHRVPQRRLEDIVGQVDEPFKEMLFRLINERQDRHPDERDADIYKRANITKSVFNAISNRPNHNPNKNTAICLAFALELSLDVTLDLLGRLGYTLSPSSVHDLIVKYFVTEGIYDVHRVNETLFEYGQGLLGSSME